ncbi:putative tyrosine carboxypeptidase MATCAP2 isoform X2 [Malaclemys terrapin pileata]|uniref:putative tyrosine carboxypeptidase MATCAP2 isoform X2 n=1 Tax=Malaclemys terrapin pileata TaxID=2991368 RepID=UPI0023A7F5FB|nr:putative tyrosine carboxypeptidase MATCAP2 isoform X2 [Malaclemys terrapin pileata]
MMLESIRVTEKLHWPEQELSKKSVLNPEEHKLTIQNESSLQHLSSGILKDIFTTGTSSYNVLLQSKEEKKHHSQKLSSAYHKRHRKSTKSSTTSRNNEHRKIKVPLPLLSSGWYCTNRQPSIFIASPVSSSVKFTHSISVAGNSIGLPPRPKSKAKRHYFSSLTKPKQPQLSKSHGKEVDVSGRKLCILTAIKPSNVEKEKIKFFKSDFTYNPQFEYANPALPNVLAKHSQASNKFLKQSVNIMERTLQKYGSYEKFEQATGGSLLPKSRIWNHVRKYMVKEGCLGEIVVHLTEDLLSRASMTVVNGRPTLTINVSTAREHWLEGMLRHEIAPSATVSQPSLSSHSQRLAWIRHKKKRTREDMFSELIACSRAQAAQQTQWRENLTRMHQANMDREERWRQEDQQATQTLLGLMREQTDTLRRLVDVLQERRQEDRAPLQSISNRPPPPPSPILPSPKVHRRRGGRVPANSHSTPAESSSSRRLSFPKI